MKHVKKRKKESVKEKYEHEADAGREYNRSVKHRRRESAAMKKMARKK